jgi:hypothetical protein
MSSRSPSWYADVPTRTPAPAVPRGPARGSCSAVDTETGLRCRLPAHPGDVHRHERGPFTRVAAPGQTSFARVEQLVAAATAHSSYDYADAGDTPNRRCWGKGEEEKRRRDRGHKRAQRLRERETARALAAEVVHG